MLTPVPQNDCSLESSKGYHVLSIDPGSRKGLGIAISEINGDLMSVKHVCTINLVHQCKLDNLDPSMTNRLFTLKNVLCRMMKAWDVKAVVIEDCYFSGIPQAYRALISTICTVEDVVNSQLGLGELVKFTASQIKVAVGAVGNSGNKLEVRNGLLKIDSRYLQLPVVQIYNILDEHSVDAIAVGYALHRRRLEHEYSKTFDDPWRRRT